MDAHSLFYSSSIWQMLNKITSPGSVIVRFSEIKVAQANFRSNRWSIETLIDRFQKLALWIGIKGMVLLFSNNSATAVDIAGGR